MTEMLDPKAVTDAIAIAKIKATVVPLREDDADDRTVHGLQEPVNTEISSFSGFSDFDLDLSCLSPPASPPRSISDYDLRPTSPLTSHRRFISFHSSCSSQSPAVPPRKSPSPRLSPTIAVAAIRGSWPLMKYVGRGTPIDKGRRIEWGAIGGEDVGEDGVLFSAIRSTSLDSALRPSHRSISPEWNFLNPSSLARRPSALSTSNQNHAPDPPEADINTPEIHIEGLGADNPGEWASFMQTVLGSTDSSTASMSGSMSDLPQHAIPLTQDVITEPEIALEPTPDLPSAPIMSPEEIRQLDTGLEMNLGIDAALDLGLGYRGGMNWFALGMLPASGRESPSVYSSRLPSPRPSPPPSIIASEHRSSASTKAETNNKLEAKWSPQLWWRKVLKRIHHLYTSLGSH